MPEWVFRLLLGGVILAVLVGSNWLYRLLSGAPRPGVVTGSPYCAAGGVLALPAGSGSFCSASS